MPKSSTVPGCNRSVGRSRRKCWEGVGIFGFVLFGCLLACKETHCWFLHRNAQLSLHVCDLAKHSPSLETQGTSPSGSALALSPPPPKVPTGPSLAWLAEESLLPVSSRPWRGAFSALHIHCVSVFRHRWWAPASHRCGLRSLCHPGLSLSPCSAQPVIGCPSASLGLPFTPGLSWVSLPRVPK